MFQLSPPTYQQSAFQRIHRFVILALILQNKMEQQKACICCASTRAVHLELTLNLNVPSFLLTFRRFVGRHGLPNTLLSDNAKTFRAATRKSVLLYDQLKSNNISQSLNILEV